MGLMSELDLRFRAIEKRLDELEKTMDTPVMGSLIDINKRLTVIEQQLEIIHETFAILCGKRNADE